MKEWIWVIKEYRVPQPQSKTVSVDEWIYTCRNKGRS